MPEEDLRTGTAEAVRAAFERLPLLVARFEGPQHVFVACNAAWRTLVGREDLIGRRLCDVSPETVGQQLIGWLDHAYSSGHEQRMSQWRVQVTGPDGSLREVFLDATVGPWRGSDGRVAGLDCWIFDATERVLARAEQAARTEEEAAATPSREVVTALQREMLPTGLPVLPEVRLSAGYLIADEGQPTGGDWFDAVVLPDGRVGVAVGDVVGFGVAAAAAMGQLRALLQHALREEDGDVAGTLRLLDRAAAHVPGARTATVLVAVVTPHSGAVEFAGAGHPPPLQVNADGEARYLPPAPGGPLGTGSEYSASTTTLDPGDVLLLYSDGLVERPHRDPAASMVEIARVVGDVHGGRALVDRGLTDVERLCTQTLELLVRPTGHTDDITVLAVGRQQAPSDLSLEVPAVPASLAETRRAIGRWLRAAGTDATDVTALQLVVGELVTNVVEHAYLNGSAAGPAPTVRLHLHLDHQGTVAVEVADRGRWRSADTQPGRGRGLLLSTRLVDSLVIDRAPGGTTVTVRQRLAAAAHVLTDTQLSSLVAVPESTLTDDRLLLVLDQPRDTPGAEPAPGGLRYERRLRVDGPLDAMTAPELALDLSSEVARGASALLLDLTGVTHLASAGVAALFAAADEARRNGMQLHVYAPLGSTAQQIMALVELAHLTVDPEVHPS